MRQLIVCVMSCFLVSWFSSSSKATAVTFMAEADLGLISPVSSSAGSQSGIAGSLLFGVGGRIPGSFTRAYFVFEALSGSYYRWHEQNFRRIELQREILNLGFGLRLVRPVFSPYFRVFGDVQGVLIRCATTISGEYLPQELDNNRLGGGLRMGGGFQIRPHQVFSIGGRMSISRAISDLFEDHNSPLKVSNEAGHWETSLQVTLYF